MGNPRINQRHSTMLVAGSLLTALLAFLVLSGRVPMHLKTVSDESLQELGISLYQPGTTAEQVSVSQASALAIVQHSYAGMGPVKEEVLARVHFANGNGASVNDQICWVLVQPTGSKAFGLEVIDAHTGSVLWSGGEMATGGGQ